MDLEATNAAPAKAKTDKITLTVIYNGVPKQVAGKDDELVSKLLEKAIHEFGITHQPHLLSLFRSDGTQVEDGHTLEQAHLYDGEELLLRPDTVKGGSA